MDVCWFVYEISHRRWETVGFGGHRQPPDRSRHVNTGEHREETAKPFD